MSTYPPLIPAITLHQPWASFIAHGMKQIETRSWVPKYRGPIAIHAAKKVPPYANQMLEQRAIFRRLLRQCGADRIEDLPAGAVIAIATIADAGRITRFTEYHDQHTYEARLESGRILEVGTIEEQLGNYDIGRAVWMLTDVGILEQPIPATGHQGLWWFRTNRLAAGAATA